MKSPRDLEGTKIRPFTAVSYLRSHEVDYNAFSSICNLNNVIERVKAFTYKRKSLIFNLIDTYLWLVYISCLCILRTYFYHHIQWQRTSICIVFGLRFPLDLIITNFVCLCTQHNEFRCNERFSGSIEIRYITSWLYTFIF